ncbi:replicative DNA helicase dnab [Bacillus sp. OxB-1]|uniref:replication initiation and membrane attachment family protein n=1 Tax=Bacillus sp. (strain OxB-1) TaxID=98228 RepID=UPI000581D4A5|nr:DnaD domain protein [Bacillus sp. OxB-1]BAQ11724.1 replicative DNA helicase dnab [Bacillus sp. OxB-1]
MMLYKELQPIDTYTIKCSHPFSDYDRQLLTLFYQPLIGSDAMSLFLLFWADAERDDGQGYTHYRLMNFLTKPLGSIFEARISLEAIGLLRTFRKDGDEGRTFLYELLPPLDARSFFSDPLLSTFLFSKIGEQAYRNLRNRFLDDLQNGEGFEEVSRTFLDVYTPSQFGQSVSASEGSQFKGRVEPTGVPFGQYDFDFDLLRAGLSEQMVPQSALSLVSRDLISKLAFLYSLTPIDMQKVVMMALDDKLQLPEDRLRRAAADFYKMNVSKAAPALQKTFASPEPKPQNDSASREDDLIYYLENTAPVDMLRHIVGKEPLAVNVQLAERLINTHGLPVGVVNVLMQYILLRNDMKITNNFAEQIAAHWQGKKVKTAKEAMELSRKEHDQYMKWLNDGKNTSTKTKKKPSREEKVPEWFYKKEEGQQEKPAPTNPDLDAERRRLLEELGVTEKGVN